MARLHGTLQNYLFTRPHVVPESALSSCVCLQCKGALSRHDARGGPDSRSNSATAIQPQQSGHSHLATAMRPQQFSHSSLATAIQPGTGAGQHARQAGTQQIHRPRTLCTSTQSAARAELAPISTSAAPDVRRTQLHRQATATPTGSTWSACRRGCMLTPYPTQRNTKHPFPKTSYPQPTLQHLCCPPHGGPLITVCAVYGGARLCAVERAARRQRES